MDFSAAGGLVRTLASGALSALYPPHCMSCGTHLDPCGGSRLCDGCSSGFKPVIECCAKCGTPAGPFEEGIARCESCKGRKLHFTAARGAFLFDGPVRRLLHRLKFQSFAAAAELLGRMAAERLKAGVFPDNPRFDAIVPVPSGFWQRFRRGFNQSELVAAALSGAFGLPVLKALRKTRATSAQVGLDREARLNNLRGAFAARPGRVRPGCRLLILDDVITTSSTVSECSKALLDAGAEEVFAFAVARQP